VKSETVNFAAIKQGVSLEAVLKHYRVEGLQGRRGRYRGRCPIHGGEGRDAFHVDLERKIFSLFLVRSGWRPVGLGGLTGRMRGARSRVTAEGWVCGCGDAG